MVSIMQYIWFFAQKTQDILFFTHHMLTKHRLMVYSEDTTARWSILQSQEEKKLIGLVLRLNTEIICVYELQRIKLNVLKFLTYPQTKESIIAPSHPK